MNWTALGALLLGGFVGYYLAFAHLAQMRLERMSWPASLAWRWHKYFSPEHIVRFYEVKEAEMRKMYGVELMRVMSDRGGPIAPLPRSMEAVMGVLKEAEQRYQKLVTEP